MRRTCRSQRIRSQNSWDIFFVGHKIFGHICRQLFFFRVTDIWKYDPWVPKYSLEEYVSELHFKDKFPNRTSKICSELITDRTSMKKDEKRNITPFDRQIIVLMIFTFHLLIYFQLILLYLVCISFNLEAKFIQFWI